MILESRLYRAEVFSLVVVVLDVFVLGSVYRVIRSFRLVGVIV